HLLRDGQTRRVVAGPVDPKARRQLLDGLGHTVLVDHQLTMGIHRHQVVSNTHCASSLIVCCLPTSCGKVCNCGLIEEAVLRATAAERMRNHLIGCSNASS